MEDELESLRQKSARATDVYEEMEYDEPAAGGGGFFSRLTPQQRMILAILFLLDVLVVGCGLLVVTGQIALPF